MIQIKKLVLDILKPHQPNVLELSCAVAEVCAGSKVRLTVIEVDAKTETVSLVIDGEDLNIEAITAAITSMGGSLHSIDEVAVANGVTAGEDGG
jgi:hypothetical protein